MKRKFLFHPILLFIAVSLCFRLIFTAAANPVWDTHGSLPPTPDEEGPIIVVVSPKTNSTFDSDEAVFKFCMAPPTSWMTYDSSIMSAYYTLDGTIRDLAGEGDSFIHTDWRDIMLFGQISSGGSLATRAYIFNLTELSEGKHTFRVYATSIGYYRPDSADPYSKVENFTVTSHSETITFYINKTALTATPTASSTVLKPTTSAPAPAQTKTTQTPEPQLVQTKTPQPTNSLKQKPSEATLQTTNDSGIILHPQTLIIITATSILTLILGLTAYMFTKRNK